MPDKSREHILSNDCWCKPRVEKVSPTWRGKTPMRKGTMGRDDYGPLPTDLPD